MPMKLLLVALQLSIVVAVGVSVNAPHPPPPRFYHRSSANVSHVCVLSAYGAKGDAVTDDTAAVQAAFDACSSGGVVVVDEGAYLLLRTVTVANGVDIRGEGSRAVLLWGFPGDLLVWEGSVGMVTISDLTIGSVRGVKPLHSTAMRFSQGIVRSTIANVLFVGQGPVATRVGDLPTALLGTCLDLGPITDTVTVRDCVLWFFGGTGILIGRGSEVRIEGGRIIGPGVRTDSSVGVHVQGNNGGVHVDSTDVIGLHVGMILNNTSGAGSNR